MFQGAGTPVYSGSCPNTHRGRCPNRGSRSHCYTSADFHAHGDAHGDASADPETPANFDARAYSGTPTDRDAHALCNAFAIQRLLDRGDTPRSQVN